MFWVGPFRLKAFLQIRHPFGFYISLGWFKYRVGSS